MALSFSFRRTALICTLVSVFPFLGGQAQTIAADTLEGVWGAEVRIGVPVQGQLTVDGRNGAWLASIDGYEVPVEANGREIDFKLSEDGAEFRGARESGTSEHSRAMDTARRGSFGPAICNPGHPTFNCTQCVARDCCTAGTAVGRLSRYHRSRR